MNYFDASALVKRYDELEGGGTLSLTLRTQENTREETKKLLEHMQSTFRFERP